LCSGSGDHSTFTTHSRELTTGRLHALAFPTQPFPDFGPKEWAESDEASVRSSRSPESHCADPEAISEWNIKGVLRLWCCLRWIALCGKAKRRTTNWKSVLHLQYAGATQMKGGHMAAKRTYSVRLEDEQRQQLEARAAAVGEPVGHMIRLAIADFLRQRDELDYLDAVEARIAATINRLARQVEKDRAEQQIVIGVLDYLREWLSFTLPSPSDKDAANALMKERNKNFLARLPLQFANGSKAKVTAYMETKTGEFSIDQES